MKNKIKFKTYIITIHPESFPGVLGYGVVGRALKNEQWSLNIINLHEFALDKHQSVDDTPFGGGAGMVIRPDVLGRAIDHAINLCKDEKYQIIFPTPRGEILQQEIVQELSLEKNLIFICGRFEGIDERIMEKYPILNISLGDFILAGGEIATQAILESIIRLHNDVLGNKDSLEQESFNNNLLEYPQYTKPRNWNGLEVPEILFSGHHKKIHDWRIEQSQKITKKIRPDLWEKLNKNK